MKPSPLKNKRRHYHGDKQPTFGESDIKNAIIWLKTKLLDRSIDGSTKTIFEIIDKAFEDVK